MAIPLLRIFVSFIAESHLILPRCFFLSSISVDDALGASYTQRRWANGIVTTIMIERRVFNIFSIVVKEMSCPVSRTLFNHYRITTEKHWFSFLLSYGTWRTGKDQDAIDFAQQAISAGIYHIGECSLSPISFPTIEYSHTFYSTPFRHSSEL